MGDYSGSVGSDNNRQFSHEGDQSTCRICNGRKYILVATRKMNQTSVVYDRQVCKACTEDESNAVTERYKQAPQSGKKALSGTGYLRNKKRRRKETG